MESKINRITDILRRSTPKNPTKNRPLPRPTLPKNPGSQKSTTGKNAKPERFKSFYFRQGFSRGVVTTKNLETNF